MEIYKHNSHLHYIETCLCGRKVESEFFWKLLCSGGAVMYSVLNTEGDEKESLSKPETSSGQANTSQGFSLNFLDADVINYQQKEEIEHSVPSERFRMKVLGSKV